MEVLKINNNADTLNHYDKHPHFCYFHYNISVGVLSNLSQMGTEFSNLSNVLLGIFHLAHNNIFCSSPLLLL